MWLVFVCRLQYLGKREIIPGSLSVWVMLVVDV